MSAVLNAILAKDINTLTQALESGASSNVTGMNGLHALHYTAMLNRFDMFKVLVEHGADVNAVDFHNNTTLYFVARHMGSADFVQYTIDTGVDINAQNKIGQTASIIATRLGNTEGLQNLLQNGANPNLQNIQGKAALHDAVNKGNEKAALLLIEYGADIHLPDDHGRTAASEADKSNDAGIQLLFNLPIIDQIALRPEHAELLDAVLSDTLENVVNALNANPNPDVTNHNGFTALHYAVLNGNTDIVDHLLDNGATLIRTNYDGLQAMHFASMTHNQEMLNTLVEKGGAINATDEFGNTPLHYAVLNHGDSALVQHVIKLGGIVNNPNQEGETPLHIAAKEGNTDVVSTLLANGADKLLEDNQGDTALQEASNSGFGDVIALLKSAETNHQANSIKLSEVLNTAGHEVLSESQAQHFSPSTLSDSSLSSTLHIMTSGIPEITTDELS